MFYIQTLQYLNNYQKVFLGDNLKKVYFNYNSFKSSEHQGPKVSFSGVWSARFIWPFTCLALFLNLANQLQNVSVSNLGFTADLYSRGTEQQQARLCKILAIHSLTHFTYNCM